MNEHSAAERGQNLIRYLSPIHVWALSFGCAVGWGSFIMPGTTFLPVAGPLGTALGIGIGAVLMFVIGVNYHFLMNRYPDAGGTLTYASKVFGYDHGFISSWFLILVYVAIMWANATALTLVFRNLSGGLFQFGFHYVFFGYDVYFGEALLTVSAIVLVGLICMNAKRISVWLQTGLALILFGGIIAAFAAVMRRHTGGAAAFSPLFAPGSGNVPGQVLRIVALSPWAFVGFESVSHSVEGFRFSLKKTIWIFLAALLSGAAAYILLTLIAAGIQPEGYSDWAAYIAGLGELSGVEAMPAFFATETALGTPGVILLLVTLLGGVFTGLIGNLIAASRLLYVMAEDNILPGWFGTLNRHGAPRNAIVFLMLISLVIPFFGRTAIGWIVDVNTIGAVIAYGYTSAAALVLAGREKRKPEQATGAAGLLVSVILFIYFMVSVGSMATESFLILALWSISGFVFFRYVFHRDAQRRFGRSTVVWLGLLFLIFFTSLMWVRQATTDATQEVLKMLNDYNAAELTEHGVWLTEAEYQDAVRYLDRMMGTVRRTLNRNSFLQMLLIVAGLGIMFSVYTTMSRRERQADAERLAAEAERERAEQSSRAKSTFLSNMSHDIRTPMNAIIGYTALAKKENDPAAVREYLGKIEASGQHLLALINDVLEMSRIESGKMELEPVGINLRETLEDVRDMFRTQMETKGLRYTVDTGRVEHPYVLCDKHRLNRVLLNLVSNAYKFTPAGGTVAVTLAEIPGAPEGTGDYELRVRDTGIGMSPAFAATVFEAFTREKTSTVSGIQGTGLGMAITKHIVDLMGGEIEVKTAPDQGTEFIIRLRFPFQSPAEIASEEKARETAETQTTDFSGVRVLLVDDNAINREIATLLLEESGFLVDTAEDGREAVERVGNAAPGTYGVVLMDIQMPVMNGYEATAAIRGLNDPALAGIPIIAMTANAFAEDIQAAREAGMDGHIAKPIEIRKMLSTLKEILPP